MPIIHQHLFERYDKQVRNQQVFDFVKAICQEELREFQISGGEPKLTWFYTDSLLHR